MKRTFIVLIGVIGWFVQIQSQEGFIKPYNIKSGIIKYSYSGDKVGEGTLYFDDFGRKTALFTDAMKNGEFVRGWIVTYGDLQYMWDPDNPTGGMKLKNPLAGWTASVAERNMESYIESMYAKLGLERSGTQLFMGKECSVLKGEMGKVLIWNGILMLLDLKMTGYSTHEEVTSIRTNIPVDAKYFIIPSYIKFSEIPGF